MASRRSSSGLSCKTPSRQGLTVPPGFIMAHIRWRGCNILKQIKKKMQLLYIEEGNVIDFHPSGKMAVLYLSESDIVGQSNYKTKIAKLSRCTGFSTLCVIFEKTSLTEQFFYDIQNLVVIELGMNIFAVSNQEQGAETLVQMANAESKTPGRNPFRRNNSVQNAENSILDTVKLFPGVGPKKACDMITKYENVKNITEASPDSLKSVIGSAGVQLSNFFNKELK